MFDIVVIPCGAKKRTGRYRARDLYTGAYFRSCLSYALSIRPSQNIFILSAKYGLLALDDLVYSYDLTLGQPGSISVSKVKQQAATRGISDRKCLAIGGKRYTEMCQSVWVECEAPLQKYVKGGMGKQLEWMKKNRGKMP